MLADVFFVKDWEYIDGLCSFWGHDQYAAVIRTEGSQTPYSHQFIILEWRY